MISGSAREKMLWGGASTTKMQRMSEVKEFEWTSPIALAKKLKRKKGHGDYERA